MNSDLERKADAGQAEATSLAGGPAKPKNQLLKQLVGVALAAVFLWLTFANTDFKQLFANLRQLNPAWLVAVAASCIISHYLRALRWCILLKPLSTHKISSFNSFCAVMVGYAVNIVVPRGGEFARIISISKSESLPWMGVLPTMFIDRLLDIALLVLLLGVTLLLLPPELIKANSWLLPVGGAMCVATVAGLVLLPKGGKIIAFICNLDPLKKLLPEKILGILEDLAAQFEQGTKSLSDARALPQIALMSVLIWVCYFANLYFMIWAFNLQSKVDMVHALVVFTIGSVGVLVPTPGSVGSYHLLVSKALNMVSGIDPSMALAFTTVLHAFSFILVTCLVAAVCFAIQSGRKSKSSDKPDESAAAAATNS